MHAVGHLVGIDADERRPDAVDRRAGTARSSGPRSPRGTSPRAVGGTSARTAASGRRRSPRAGSGSRAGRRAAGRERGALEGGADAALVQPVADLVHGAEERLEVVLVVAGRDADIGRREPRAERMNRRVEPERLGLEAEGGDRRETELGAARLRGTARRRFPFLHRLAAAAISGISSSLSRAKTCMHLGRRRPRLEVVEEDVVGVGGGLEARDVLLLELELPVEPRAGTRRSRWPHAQRPRPPCPPTLPWSARRRDRRVPVAPSPSRDA